MDPAIWLPTLWFLLIVVLWVGFLFLEGFDLGVGILIKIFGRSHIERRVLLNTIGPVWDGNEVWLITAIGAMFAAFPMWYAALLSALYIPMVMILLGLIFRATALEFRGKIHARGWSEVWDWCLCLGSLLAASGIGATLALTSTGLPLNSHGDRVGGAWAWMNGYALLGAAASVTFCVSHACAFVALKTEGPIRGKARQWFIRGVFPCAVPMLAWGIFVQIGEGAKAGAWILLLLALGAVVFAWWSARRGREGWAFLGSAMVLVTVMASIFLNLYPRVLPSTLAEGTDLTVTNAASAPYTLGVMSVVALFGLPIVLLYQGWTYWVFRKRISEQSIPA